MLTGRKFQFCICATGLLALLLPLGLELLGPFSALLPFLPLERLSLLLGLLPLFGSLVLGFSQCQDPLLCLLVPADLLEFPDGVQGNAAVDVVHHLLSDLGPVLIWSGCVGGLLEELEDVLEANVTHETEEDGGTVIQPACGFTGEPVSGVHDHEGVTGVSVGRHGHVEQPLEDG